MPVIYKNIDYVILFISTGLNWITIIQNNLLEMILRNVFCMSKNE